MKKLDINTALILFSSLFILHQPRAVADSVNLKENFIVNCQTTKNYGLNSYYLFLHQPVFNEHTTALKQTEFLLRKLKKIKQLSSNIPIEQQQTIYIPVSFEPQSWVQQPDETDFEAAARWIMHNYDYQCAKDLLESFPKLTDNGPYILSSTRILKVKKQKAYNPWRNPVLVQNLSETEPAKFYYWLEIFFKKSWQPRPWPTERLIQLHENMLESLHQHELQLKENIAHENNKLLENPQDNIPLKPTPPEQEEASVTLFTSFENNDKAVTENQTEAENQPASEKVPKPMQPQKPDLGQVEANNPLLDNPEIQTTPQPLNPYKEKITIQYSGDTAE